jgi:hypothetical protein
MTIQFVLAVLVLGFAIVLTFRAQPESVVSLAAGALVTLMFGIQELWGAVQLQSGSQEQTLAIGTSVALTGTSALLTRLLLKRVRRQTALR